MNPHALCSAAESEAPRRFGEQHMLLKAVSPLRSATALQIRFRHA